MWFVFLVALVDSHPALVNKKFHFFFTSTMNQLSRTLFRLAPRTLPRIQPFQYSSIRHASLFGELTKKSSAEKPLEQQVEEEVDFTGEPSDVTPSTDKELQEYHLKEALERQFKIDKYITPLKKQLFEQNVQTNGFFKNNQVVSLNNKQYKLELTEEEIELLEPSIYLRSYRIKSSMKKATQVNRFVRGFNVKVAINQLHFNPKKMSTELEQLLKKGLEQARELQLNEDGMYIHSLWVGSDGGWIKRPDIKGRGRTGILEHPYVHLRAILRSDQTKRRKEWESKVKEVGIKPRMFLNNEPLNFKVRPVYKW